MKKLYLFMLLILLLIFVVSCTNIDITLTPIDTIDYTEEIKALAKIIDESVPEVVNSNFSLPVENHYDITYTFGDSIFTNEFIYESPFFDRDATLEYKIKRGVTELTFTTEFRHLSLESGYNNTKIYLTLPVPLGQVGKEDYVQTNVRVETKKNSVGVIEHETAAAQLRGRGNSTWFLSDKKPYRLRFDENTSILGMPEAKNYVLLAEFADKSLMRNVITQKMVSLMDDLPYSLETRFVELYVNDDYRGVYVLTEHVEVHKNKFMIESIPGEINTGYFFEMDQRFYDHDIIPGWDWFVVRGVPYEIKDPDSDDLNFTSGHATYIKAYVEMVENMLIAKSNYQSYINLDNWIAHFIVHEFVKNVDVGWSSVFMYKEKDGPLQYGPLWDFDLAYGNADYIDYGPEGFYGMRQHKNRMFKLMMDILEVRLLYRERYNDFYLDVLPQVLEMIPVLAESISNMAHRNFLKWDIMNRYIWPNPWEVLAETTHQGQVQYVMSFMNQRAEWMLNEINNQAFYYGQFGD
ncbi:MAG: CotH kinase family protein [Acholeplasmataceae bacterium]|nr:CotH kinase family protein [Acholeplasmataceae bacterium]